MRRKTRAVPFAGRRLTTAIRKLEAVSSRKWPKHLRRAKEVLADLSLDEKAACRCVIESYRAAHACAEAINQRSANNIHVRGRLRLHKVFARVGRGVRRAPSALRRVLNEAVQSSICDTVVDAESIDAFIEAIIAGFASLPSEKTSLMVLRATTLTSPQGAHKTSTRSAFDEASRFLTLEYSSLSAMDQRKVEKAVLALRSTKSAPGAADVCEAIANALENDEEINIAAHDLITDYVTAVGKIWVRQGLKPGRAVDPADPSCRSNFQRFAELVLTHLVEPWSKRPDGVTAEMLARLRKIHEELPADMRKSVSPAPRRSDVQDLISEDHVKKALARLKK